MGRTFIIAEMAGCHDGKLANAIELIHIAKACGADAVKTQWTSNPVKMAARRKIVGPHPYGLLFFPQDWLAALRQEAHAAGLEFLCTVFLREDVAEVAPLVDRFKIASLEADDRDFFIDHAQFRKPIILSTGAMTEWQVNNIRSRLQMLNSDWALLHCLAAYPAPLDELSLCLLRERDYFDGFSDHTASTLTGAVAVGAGARILEVHCRLEETDRGNPDFNHSLVPTLLGKYIRNVRFAERMIGSPPKQVQPSEAGFLAHRVIS